VPELTRDRPREAESTGAWVPFAGLLIGVWAIIPPYIKAFGDLGVDPDKEFADHVIPGIVVVAVCLLGCFLLRAPEPAQMPLFVSGLVISLAGLWMVSTHVGLIGQVQDGIVTGSQTAWHGIPGVAVLLLGVVWTIRFWGSEADEVPSGR
jgi:hypothetical protein